MGDHLIEKGECVWGSPALSQDQMNAINRNQNEHFGIGGHHVINGGVVLGDTLQPMGFNDVVPRTAFVELQGKLAAAIDAAVQHQLVVLHQRRHINWLEQQLAGMQDEIERVRERDSSVSRAIGRHPRVWPGVF